MKKFVLSAASLALLIIGAGFWYGLAPAGAQILTDTGDPGGLEDMTKLTADTANFGTLEVGPVVAIILQAVLSFLGITFIILMVVAGWRWMTAQGDAEAITKSKDSIRSALIGLIVVLGAYAITYFVFRAIPFGGTGVPPQGQTSG